MLLDASILGRLKHDFPDMRIQDPDEYVGYIEEYYREYARNTFAMYNGYRFDILCTGVLAQESLVNKLYDHLKLNDYLGFCLVDTRRECLVKVESYADIQRVLADG